LATELDRYLRDIRENLRLDPGEQDEVLTELEAHAEDRLEEMKEAGLSEEEAVQRCVGLLGSARVVARQIYEAHSQGTWKQALLASMPHLIFAGLFALKWWGSGWLPVAMCPVVATAVFSWGRGRPSWLFPWLGYALLPVVIAGLLLLYLPTGWAWSTILLYVPLVLWLLSYITIKAIKKDWLYIGLMLLPVPSFVGWFLAAQQDAGFAGFSLGTLNHYALWIGLTSLVLAVSAAVFVRLRKRWLKTTVLVVSGLLTLGMVAVASGRLSFPVFLALAILFLISLSVPALLEHRLRHSRQPLTP